MIGVDTNVLVRYFADDDVAQSPVAARFVERTLGAGRPGHVSLVVLAELVWVLRSRYAAGAPHVTRIVTEMLSDPRFVVQDAEAAWLALDWYREDGVDFADALIVAVDRRHGCTHTMTFDEKAGRIPGMKLLR